MEEVKRGKRKREERKKPAGEPGGVIMVGDGVGTGIVPPINYPKNRLICHYTIR